MTAHAKLSASGSKRWISCPASVQAEAGLPDSGGNIYADEGTAAHDLGERCLRDGVMASSFIGESITAGSHTFEVDEDMASAVQVYVDYCNNLPVEVRLLEQRVRFDKWVPDGFGTSDFIGIGKFSKKKPDRKVVHVVDYKHGKGVMVDALDNSQAMLYGLGVINTLGFIYNFQEDDQIVCTIVQPRLDHISEFTITVGDLLRWAEKTILPAVKEAYSDNPTYNPGDEQCRWCKAKATCRAVAEENLKVVAQDFTAIDGDFECKDRSKLTPAEIGSIMQKLKGIYDWGKAVEAHGFNLSMNGTKVPGFKVVAGKPSNRAWSDEEEVKMTLIGKLYLEDEDVYDTKLKSPAVIEKLIKAKKLDKDKKLSKIATRFLKPKKDDKNPPVPFWSQKKGNPTIAPESDKRDALTIKPDVETDFTAIN